MRAPADARRQERPLVVFADRDRPVAAGPCARGAGGDDMAVAVLRVGRRRGEIARGDSELHEDVEKAQRLVVGDVFLGLCGKDQRQVEEGRGVGHGRLLSWDGATLRAGRCAGG